MSSIRSHQHPASSQHGLRRCLSLGLCLGLLLIGGIACRQPPPPRQTQLELRQQQQTRQAAQQCSRRREALRSRLDQLQQQARQLVRLRGAVPPVSPAAGPRPIWDEAKERRYSLTDQELDRQAYERELQAWHVSQAAFQARWRRSQARRVARAQSRLNRLAAELRQEHPQLFSGSTSIEVDPTALQQLSHCPPLPT